MVKRVALYVRVSTDDQTVDNQILELEAMAERQGWIISQVYKDQGISGSKGREGRPGFDALSKAVIRKEIDLVAVWSVDRLGRSLQSLVDFLQMLHEKGVGLYLHQQGLDTTTSAGKAMFQMMGVFAEFERAMIKERVRAGLQRAQAQGKVLGRPKVTSDIEEAICKARDTGKGMIKIAKELGVGVSTVQRVLREAASA